MSPLLAPRIVGFQAHPRPRCGERTSVPAASNFQLLTANLVGLPPVSVPRWPAPRTARLWRKSPARHPGARERHQHRGGRALETGQSDGHVPHPFGPHKAHLYCYARHSHPSPRVGEGLGGEGRPGAQHAGSAAREAWPASAVPYRRPCGLAIARGPRRPLTLSLSRWFLETTSEATRVTCPGRGPRPHPRSGQPVPLPDGRQA